VRNSESEGDWTGEKEKGKDEVDEELQTSS